jgi:hypothetical protein
MVITEQTAMVCRMTHQSAAVDHRCGEKELCALLRLVSVFLLAG